jgi:drug/metabolite transporter (DMT)-like permease
MHTQTLAPPLRLKLVAAFAALYLIWGSTYLGIRVAIETIPPFLMAGGRFLVAGVLLYGWCRWRGMPAPAWRDWKIPAITGAFLLLGGNGGVVWAEQYVPSSLAALLVAIVPLWLVLLDWRMGGAPAPRWPMWLGLAVGFGGVVLLTTARNLARSDAPTQQDAVLLGAAAVVAATISWAFGSIYARKHASPLPLMQVSALQMICGGGLLLLAGTVTGEWIGFSPAAISGASVVALLYLVVFGSLVAFSAYTWLLTVSTPARVGTYAYVNPIVAVFLGWLVAGELVTGRMLLAGGLILGAVLLITTTRQR